MTTVTQILKPFEALSNKEILNSIIKSQENIRALEGKLVKAEKRGEILGLIFVGSFLIFLVVFCIGTGETAMLTLVVIALVTSIVLCTTESPERIEEKLRAQKGYISNAETYLKLRYLDNKYAVD